MSDAKETVEAEVVELEFKPAVFDPAKAELQAIAEEVASITADPAKMTKEDFELIKSTKNKVVKMRTRIQKRGLELRAAANKYNSDVLEYEKGLIAIIEPEEKRLKELQAAAEEYAMKQERLKTLPEFKEKLASIGDGIEATDEELLALDPNGRDAYYNQRLGAHLEAKKAEDDARKAQEEEAKRAEEERLAKERREMEQEKERIAMERRGVRIERLLSLGFRNEGDVFRFDEKVFIARDGLDIPDTDFNEWLDRCSAYIGSENRRKEAEAEEKRQADLKAAAETARKEEEERQRKAKEDEEAARLAEEEKQRAAEAERARTAGFENWQKENSYNPETDKLIYENGVTTLYRAVATYNHST